MAYKAEIDVKVRNLGSISQLEKKLSSISKNVNAINKKNLKGGGGGSRATKDPLKDELASLRLQNTALSNINRAQRAANKLKDIGVTLEEEMASLQKVAGRSVSDSLSQDRKTVELQKKKIQNAERLILITQKQQKGQAEVAKATERTLTAQDRINVLRLRGSANKLAGGMGGFIDSQRKGVGPGNLLALPSSKDIKGRGIERLGETVRDKAGEFTASSVEKAEFFEKRRNAAIERGIEANNKLVGSERIRNRQTIRVNRAIEKNNRQTIRQANNLVKLGDRFGQLGTNVAKFQDGLLKTRGPGGSMLALPSAQMMDQRVKATGQAGGFSRAIPRFRMPSPTRGFDFESALISGGFPLLFGQGPGIAAAGALGGGIGGMFGGMGGFAGGIAATAAVQSIQNVIKGIGELGQAMNRLNPNISAMSQAMGIAGTAEEKRLQLIEKNLGKQAAFNAALEMLGEKIGADQAEELRKFGETFQRLGNEVTLFFTKVQAAIAKLLNQALDAGADANVRGRARDLVAKNPNNPAFRDVNQRIKEIQARETTGRTGSKQKQDDLRAAKAERLAIAETLILEKDRDKARAQTNKLITAGLADLTKENELNKAIIAGNEEEFRIKQAVKDKVDEMGLSMKDLNDTQKQRIKDDVITNKNLKEQARIQKEIADSFKNMASTIQNDIKDGIRGLIKGTSTLGDLVNNVADRFLDMALNQALFGNVGGGSVTGGLFKFLGFANGGRPPVGKPSIVGEKGPELFVPRSSGTIVPNNKLGGGGSTSVVVNVDASGSDVQGDDAQARELGTLISVAVKGELLKQQRPGGLLSSLR